MELRIAERATSSVTIVPPKGTPLTSVQRFKMMQSLREKSAIDERIVRDGKFFVFYKGKPLLSDTFQISWVSFNDLGDCTVAKIFETSCMLGLSDCNQLDFAVEIDKDDLDRKNMLQDLTRSSFVDFRFALIMLSPRDFASASKASALLNWHRRNRYCPRCGNLSVRNPSGSCRTCSSCKQVCYPSLSPVGIVLVTNESKNKLMLVRQSRHMKGMYSCIAGFVDAGETLEESIRREVAEEVGLAVKNIEYKASQHWSFPVSNFMIGCFAVVDGSEQLDIDYGELEDARWFPVDRVRESLALIKSDPLAYMQGEFFVPPQGTVAHTLIESWLLQNA